MHGMKRIISVAAIVVVLSFAIVGTVVAFTMGNVDGLWGYIDGVTENSNTYTVRGGGAICSRWATGPVSGSSNYDSPTSTSNWNTIIQGALGGTDWNQVRYGATDSDCDSCLPFGSQSGFGFEGENDVIDPDAPYLNIPFLLGKFCHFNNPITASACGDWAKLQYVDLTIQIDNILCPGGLTPAPDGVMNFTWRFTLDETPNSGTCAYPSITPCADKVTIGTYPVTDGFFCDYGGATSEFNVEIMGFYAPNPDGTCPANPTGDSANEYISQEGADNCVCLYGRVNQYEPTAVELLSFEAASEARSAVITWVTANEVDNLGFNIYRSASADGEWVKINTDLIPTNTAPGSMEGASYEFIDEGIDLISGLKPNHEYYYWIEDVDFNGNAQFTGPVSVKVKAK